MKIRTTLDADLHIRAARDWWRTNRPAAPNLFEKELASAFARIVETPLIGVKVERRKVPGLRRTLLPKTQYHVYYVPDETQGIAVVLDVWSAVRGRGPRLVKP